MHDIAHSSIPKNNVDHDTKAKRDEQPLWSLDAHAMAAGVAGRSFSATELVRASIHRIDAVNDGVNALVRRMDEEALAAAERADDAVASGDPLGPLHGVPVTIKINIDQAGHPTDNGTALHKELIAERDNPVVANLRAAGAIIVGRTNAPVYSMRWFTDNKLHGATYNPWHRDYTVGGSSGGAAASVATGMVPIAHGNDIGGSVRYPAFCNGLTGLKPSYGRVPSFNGTAKGGASVASQLMAVQGPIARSVRDVETAFKAMAIPSIDDPRTHEAPASFADYPLRAALVPASAWADCHPSVASAVDRAGDALSKAGWEVVEATPPGLAELHQMWGQIAVPDVLAQLQPAIDASGDANIKRAVSLWQHAFGPVGVADALSAVGKRHGLLRQWMHFLSVYPVIIMPVSLAPQFPRLADIESAQMSRRIMQAQASMMVVSVLGLPGLSVPTGLAKIGSDELPTGVQVVASPFREDICFAAGRAIEAASSAITPIDPR